MSRPNTAASLTQDTYEHLRADLLACRLRPDSRLVIADIGKQLGVSLGAVREALSRLTAEGLVVAEPQRGFRVAPLSAADLSDLTNVRTMIELRCLERAIAVGDLGWEAGIQAARHRLSGTPERERDDPMRLSESWSLAHDAFHDALAAGCDSPWLVRLRRMLYAQSERYRRLSVPLNEHGRDLAGEHGDLAEAALARDVPRATKAMREHLARTTLILLSQSWTEPRP